ncbi:MAG TPA: preprotein translocase subunit SecE [Solirubrobacteraceae bacterium]
MARDRKRAKQRRDRRDRRPSTPRGGVRTDVRRDEEPQEIEAPEPLEHASAEVDLAEAQLALGRPELAPDDPPITEEELVEAEEQDEAEHPVVRSRSGAARGSRELPGNRIVSFLQGSWRELQRVQWPDRRQVAQATGVVIVFVIVAGLFLGLVDAVSQKLVDAIF